MTLSLNKQKLDNLANEIWKSAERLRGKFKAYEYQNVILPIIVIRRLEGVLIEWRKTKKEEIRKKRHKMTEKELDKLVKELELNPKQSRFSNKTLWTLRKIYEEDAEREAQRERLLDAINQIDRLPIMIDDRRGLTPMDIRATLLGHCAAFDQPALVVVDYLNLVRSESMRRSQYEQVSETVRALKDVGGELDIPMLVLAQLSREPERRSDTQKRPSLADFRDAGTIEEVASCVLALYRASYYYPTFEAWNEHNPTKPYPQKTLEVHVLKQQSGPTGMVPLYCEIESGFMGDMAVER